MILESNFDYGDIIALVGYFISVCAVGIFASVKSSKATVASYFLAGRFMTWLPVGASLFASNIGSEHFIGLAGSGAAAGIGVGAFEVNACILVQLLGWLFLPVYLASGVCTLPEYMRKRFGGNRIQLYLAGLSLLLYILTKISVNLFAGSLFLREALGWNIWYSILLLLSLTAVITIAGGLTAVIYTDTLQCFIMLIGASALSIIGFMKVGGFAGLYEQYGAAVANTTASSLLLTPTTINNNDSYLGSVPECALPSKKAFIMLRSLDDPDMPWLGFILGQTPASIWYWCTDQMMVQRTLAAKTLSHAQGGTLFAGYMKLLPLFIMVMPGMISRVLYPNEIGCSDPILCESICGQRSGCTNLAYPKLVMGLMPSGLRGLMMAVMLAALMSDLTSIFNSASTLFTVDVYRRFRKMATEAEQVLVGRCFVLVMVVLSILWIPVIKEMQGGQLFIYIQMISAYLAPPIAAVYLISVLWNRATELGAFTCLMYGLCLGLIRLLLDFIWREPLCGEVDHRPWLLQRLHYMYFALLSFLSTALIMIIVSMASIALSKKSQKALKEFQCNDDDVDTPLTCMQVIRWRKAALLQSRTPDVNCEANGVEFKEEIELQAAECSELHENNHSQAEEVIESVPSSLSNRLLSLLLFICCIKRNQLINKTDDNKSTKVKQQRRDQAIYTILHQTLGEKILLYTNLAILLTVAVSFYLFFSLYFGPINVGPGAVNPWN